jgi:hypothetical protein
LHIDPDGLNAAIGARSIIHFDVTKCLPERDGSSSRRLRRLSM